VALGEGLVLGHERILGKLDGRGVLPAHAGEGFAGGAGAAGGYVEAALEDGFAGGGKGSLVEEALVGLGGEELLGGGGRVKADAAEAVGEGVGDVYGHLHARRVAPAAGGGAVEGKILGWRGLAAAAGGVPPPSFTFWKQLVCFVRVTGGACFQA
jgi:hypothetical protein